MDEDELTEQLDVADMEHLNFEFEAFPPDPIDLSGISDLITQIFLRANVDCEALAKMVVEFSPFGCVFKPAEEYEDEEMGSSVYGVMSILDFSSAKMAQLRDFILQRVRKYGSKEEVKVFTDLLKPNTDELSENKERVGLLINERMIHFPVQIAGPAFNSLKEDYNKLQTKEKFDHIVIIIKLRVADVEFDPVFSTNSKDVCQTKKKKPGKAEKKLLQAGKFNLADLIYDNPEEELLFKTINPLYFQYPVEMDIEKGSKFHSTIKDGVIYRPFRRVCLLNVEKFRTFAETVASTYSL